MYSDEGPNKEGQKIDVLLTQTAEGLLAQLARRTMDVARKAHDNPFRDTGFRNVEPDDSTYEGRWKFQFINRQQRLEGEVMTIDENGFAIMRDVLGRRRNVSGFNHNSMRSARVWHVSIPTMSVKPGLTLVNRPTKKLTKSMKSRRKSRWKSLNHFPIRWRSPESTSSTESYHIVMICFWRTAIPCLSIQLKTGQSTKTG